MAIKTIPTRGYGEFGSIPNVVLRGYVPLLAARKTEPVRPPRGGPRAVPYRWEEEVSRVVTDIMERLRAIEDGDYK